MWHLPIWCYNYRSTEILTTLPRLTQCGCGHALNSDYYNSWKLRTDNAHWLFQVTKKGYGIFRKHGESHEVRAGMGFLCNPIDEKVEYFYPDNFSDSWEFFFLAFEGGDEIFKELIGRYGFIYEFTKVKEFISKLIPKQALEVNTQITHRLSGKEAVDYASEFINLLVESKSHLLTIKDKNDTIVSRAKLLISSNKTKKITVQFLAETLGITPEHLARAFKKESGFGPHHYIIESRLQKATNLLRSSNLKIKEIAFECGFDSARDFNRTFLKVLKQTPGEFRNEQ